MFAGMTRTIRSSSSSVTAMRAVSHDGPDHGTDRRATEQPAARPPTAALDGPVESVDFSESAYLTTSLSKYRWSVTSIRSCSGTVTRVALRASFCSTAGSWVAVYSMSSTAIR